ncbi:MAG: hypothetical protein KKA73_09530 [Chloroflexi bacterium]|nr:hypothetical protein [Chloroflexota bacterium]MBU1747918.1 hypothetical protein [Chloroflexota bacterium]
MSKTFSLMVDNQVPAGAEQLPLAALSSLARKELSLDEMGRRVRDAWYSQYRTQHHMDLDPERENCWVREVFMDQVIIEAPDGLWSYPYTVTAEGVTFGEPVPVAIEYQPVGAAADDGGNGAPNMAVKMLRTEDGGAVVGGYLALWGGPKRKDLQGEYFTKATELWLDKYPQVPCLFHHGLDPTIGLAVIGHRVKATLDDTGAWVEDWLDMSSAYWRMVKPLLEAEALYYSPGSATHLTKMNDDGELLVWPIIEDTLTVTPAQHRQRPIEQVKAAYKAAGLTWPTDLEPAPPSGGADTGVSGPDVAPDRARVKAAIDILLDEIEMEV